ncbi:MAG: DUF1566 domain-containing protein, partial [Moraxellaceae bacterium]
NNSERYINLDAKGKTLRAQKKVASCVQDNETGLVWELKTTDNGVHDIDNSFRWGGEGSDKIGSIFFDDWNTFLTTTNKEKLCGFSDWRVPTIDELKSLVVEISGSDSSEQKPTINSDYFSMTLPSAYWSASAYTNYPDHAQTVHFGSGASYYYNGYRGNQLPLRLVRGNSEKK